MNNINLNFIAYSPSQICRWFLTCVSQLPAVASLPMSAKFYLEKVMSIPGLLYSDVPKAAKPWSVSYPQWGELPSSFHRVPLHYWAPRLCYLCLLMSEPMVQTTPS